MVTVKELFDMCPSIYYIYIPTIYYEKYNKIGYDCYEVGEENIEKFKSLVVKEFWPVGEDYLNVTIKKDDIVKTNAENLAYSNKFIDNAYINYSAFAPVMAQYNQADFFSYLFWKYQPCRENWLTPEEELKEFFKEIKNIENNFARKNHIIMLKYDIFFECFCSYHKKEFEKFLKMGWKFKKDHCVIYKYFR